MESTLTFSQLSLATWTKDLFQIQLTSTESHLPVRNETGFIEFLAKSILECWLSSWSVWTKTKENTNTVRNICFSSVALNYQTEDKPNVLNRAWFRMNGSCGYVLKPEFLRNHDTGYTTDDELKTGDHWTVQIRVIAGTSRHLIFSKSKLEMELKK